MFHESKRKQSTRPRTGRAKWLNPALASGLAAALLLAAVTFWLAVLQLKLQRDDLRVDASEKLQKVAGEVGNSANSRLLLAKGLVAYVKGNPFLTADMFERYAMHLFSDEDTIRNVSLIEGTTIKFAYPHEDNKKAIGTDLAQIPAQQASVLKARDTGLPVLTGPVDLVQGGSGIIFRMPILLNEGTPTETYFGQAGIVLSTDRLLVSVARGAEDLRIELVEVLEDGGIRHVYGEALQDAAIIAEQDLHMNYTTWRLRAALAEETPGIPLDVPVTLVVGLLFSLFAGWLVCYLVKMHAHMQHLAGHDWLTGLPNRRLLSERFTLYAGLARRTDVKIGIMMLDMDGFKSVNDRHGHRTGDLLLVEVAERLKSNVRDSDTIARIGGDEFLIMLYDISSPDELDRLQTKLQAAFEMEFVLNQIHVTCRPSIGTALYPDEGTDLEPLLHHADIRMFQAKTQQRGNARTE